MAQFMQQDKVLPEEVLDKFTNAVAQQLNLKPENDYWGDIPANQCGAVGGRIGGNLVKIMIKEMEKQMAKEART